MDANEKEWMWRQAQWERLINILDEANSIQQKLLGDEDETVSYNFHNIISNLIEEFEDHAAQDEKEWTDK